VQPLTEGGSSGWLTRRQTQRSTCLATSSGESKSQIKEICDFSFSNSGPPGWLPGGRRSPAAVAASGEPPHHLSDVWRPCEPRLFVRSIDGDRILAWLDTPTAPPYIWTLAALHLTTVSRHRLHNPTLPSWSQSRRQRYMGCRSSTPDVQAVLKRSYCGGRFEIPSTTSMSSLTAEQA
jgi:hypothetical protein